MPIQTKTKRLYQKVANTLARDIRTGKFVQGQRLPAERDLAQRFEVSRPTIREAIIALEIIGLVDVRKGSGVYVADDASPTGDLTTLDIGPFELIEARTLFEGEIAALAAELATKQQIQDLESILEDMKRENREGISGEIADREFHLSIARITENSAIVSALEHLWDVRYHSPLCVRLMTQVRDKGLKPIIDDHQAIIDAIASGDPGVAKAAMRNHLSRVTEGLLEATEVDAIQRAREEVQRQRRRFANRTGAE